ncbi:hypothetical protein AAGF08_17230 [Algoriphagus sp. SE2]|uniref:hypothetical protein n=1 Tax=Algoriphagus sp. SE2 TaxID=3141536 RepID=UPI0031CCE3D9
MKGLFFDASATMLAKNHLPIAVAFDKQVNDFQAVFVSGEISSNVNIEIEKNSKTELEKFSHIPVIKEGSFTVEEISKILNLHKPDFIFIGAYRIYDQLWCNIALKRNINVYNYQHGFEVNSVNYTFRGALFKFKKSFRLISTAFRLSKFSKVNSFKLVSDYVSYILSGKTSESSLLKHRSFHPFHTFVYSDFYKVFWHNKYGFDDSKMSIITPHDFLLAAQACKSPKIKGVCYITQTLVEDGRMTEASFKRLLKDYLLIAKQSEKFIIKLHPRANIDYYKDFELLSNVTIQRDFPNCEIYLTHYSSMIFAAANISGKLILHELPKHPTPEVFYSIAPYIVHSAGEILDLINQTFKTSKPSLKVKERLDNFDFNKIEDPFGKIVEKVLTYQMNN